MESYHFVMILKLNTGCSIERNFVNMSWPNWATTL